jgi:L-threonylcarbamoyladenylate synthase
MLILKIDPKHPDDTLIKKAVNILKEGGIIAYPTETFYGLGASAENERGVEKIFRLKDRHFKNPLSLIIGERKDLSNLVDHVPETAHRLMKAFWPGALTLIFRAAPHVNPRLTAGTGKIGIRISSHPIATMLAKTLSQPITATSANLSGRTECTTADEVTSCFKNRVDALINGGPTQGRISSTILDVTTDPPEILRPGVIPDFLIQQALKRNRPE